MYPYLFNEPLKWVTVEDMYNYARDNKLSLLSLFGDNFWSDYVANSDKYDLLFKRMFKRFRYFDQDPTDENNTVEKVTREFIDDVYNHLLVNRKKYTELFRINELDSANNPIFDNVNYTETRESSSTDNNTITDGERIDNTNMVQGARTDTNSSTTGGRTDNSETKVSAFNDSEYTNSDMSIDTIGEQVDNSQNVKGEQTDTNNFTKGEQINTENKVNNSNETITKKGKVSGTSNTELIKQHLELWDTYEFYNYIFTEIASSLLLI